MAYTTVNKSTDHFDVKLWTGNGSSQTITGYGFQPDLAWIKARTTTGWHDWTDAVRGATKSIFSNSTNAEDTSATALTAFTSDGYSLGSNSQVNGNGTTYVAWNWKAGTGQGSSNTDGSINTTYTSVNTTSGFSISKYTGTGSNATIGHGLGVAPKVVMIKDLSAAKDWAVYHESIGNTKYLELNTTDAVGTASNAWNNTSPTSSVVSIGSRDTLNTSSNNYIAYCFAEKTGFSKFGSYAGSANADGPFIYTGFKPAFIILRGTNAENWIMFDNKRDPVNVVDDLILPNQNIAAFSATYLDINSNGFKLRTNAVGGNASGQEFIYMAFAEAPLVGSNNIACTAR